MMENDYTHVPCCHVCRKRNTKACLNFVLISKEYIQTTNNGLCKDFQGAYMGAWEDEDIKTTISVFKMKCPGKETEIAPCEGFPIEGERDCETNCNKGELNSSEAIYGFAAWLSCRRERTVFGSTCDCGNIAELVKEFCEVNSLPIVREDWHKSLLHPGEETLERSFKRRD